MGYAENTQSSEVDSDPGPGVNLDCLIDIFLFPMSGC